MDFGLFIVLLILLPSIKCNTEKKALLDLKVSHVAKPEFRPGDHIKYKCLVRQKEGSSFEAIDIKVKVLLPDTLELVRPTVLDTETFKGIIHNKNSVNFIIQSLPVKSQVEFSFSAVIICDDLSSGLHYASTPIKLCYKSRISADEITASHDISMVAQVPYFIAGCTQPLGISDGSIKFYQFSASSTQVDLKPHKVRMNGVDDAWCADKLDTKPYIQVFLSRKSKVSGIATWGRREKDMWVRKYTLEFSNDGSDWYAYTDTGIMRQFQANVDQKTKAMHWFAEPFEANYVRLYPIQWAVGVCMRFEIYGCELVKENNCMKPLGMENGKITLVSITEKLPPSVGFPDSRNWSRLNSVNPTFPYGWMADVSQPDYLQIDLGSSFKIMAIAIQAGYGPKPPFVTKFRVSYSLDQSKWMMKDDSGEQNREFPGSTGGMLPDMTHFSPYFTARYVRIEPTDGNVVKSLRMELYGCLADDHRENDQSADIQLSRRSVLVDEVTGFIYVCIYTHDRAKTICKRTNDGRHWISLGRAIMGVLHQARLSRRLYAIDRKFHKTFSDDNGETWFSITNNEWQHQLSKLELNSVTNIDDITATKIPDSKHTWTTQAGNKWGVSGKGIHMMGVSSVKWTLCAAWKCCGL